MSATPLSPVREKIGEFFLGRHLDPATSERLDSPLLYDANDLTTHAVAIGMTGSGKTGLGLALIEEAALDGIPAILVDPKGDLANILLTFPDLAPEDFRPWIHPEDAVRKNLSPDEYAAKTAATWKNGLASWGEDGDRIARLRAAADFRVYTPGSQAGIPLSILSSLDAPPAATLQDASALRDRVSASVSALLALAGINADPLQSREHILLSTLVSREWTAGRAVSLPALVQAIQNPGLDRVGVLPLDSFFPAKDRFALAMRFNALLASPAFASWTDGAPLDIDALLRSPSGKPRVSILSIAHLQDSERMFFVSLLLNELLAWMRRQSGSSNLRALFYMDEIFGYFPPTANPPSKPPMLLLLKQARAYGLGIVLASQNPVDLDYRGLSNCGTWFVGRLQTENDKNRVLEGLASVDAGDGIPRAKLDAMLSALDSRIFMMRNVHDDAPVLFESRWCMSYLRGPLSPDQISTLMAPYKALPAAQPTPQPAAAAPCAAPIAPAVPYAPYAPPAPAPSAPVAPAPAPAPVPAAPSALPVITAKCRIHYVSTKHNLDHWVTRSFAVPCSDLGEPYWEEIAPEDSFPGLSSSTSFPPSVTPPAVGDPKVQLRLVRDFKAALRSASPLELFVCADEKLASTPDESRDAFLLRATGLRREKGRQELQKLEARHKVALERLKTKERTAQNKLETEEAQLATQRNSFFMNLLASVLSIFGGGFSAKRAGTMARGAKGALTAKNREQKERQDIRHAEENLAAIREQIEALVADFESAKTDLLEQYEAPPSLDVVSIPPRASDLDVRPPALASRPL